MTEQTERDARTVLARFRDRLAAQVLEARRHQVAQSRLAVERHGD
jgi:hypothetical protein